MFKKLLSNLPFNPSLIGQVSFYAKRMHSETSVRRLGLFFVVIAMIIQFCAVIWPSEPSLARSGNDIIPGGVTSKGEIVSWCNTNLEIKVIFDHFGVTCAAIEAGTEKSVNSRGHGSELYSLGRLPYGKAGETPVVIGAQTFYLRYLWAWDSGASSTYKSVFGSRKDGTPFYIIYSCGNVVIVGKPAPPPPPPPPPTPTPPPPTPTSPPPTTPPPPPPTPKVPNLEFSKRARNLTQGIEDANGTVAQPGDIIEYSLITKNTGNGTKEKYIVKENLTDVLEYASMTNFHGGELGANNLMAWPARNIKAGESVVNKVTVKVKSPLPLTPSPPSNPGSFDMLMTNVYGNVINIKLPPPVIKRVETTTTLPNTGPGESLAAAFVLTTTVTYFFARSRLIAKELDIVRIDYANSGSV